VETDGKRVAVVGCGASGVQTFQTCAPGAKQITLYQRTPNFCCPMNQKDLIHDENEQKKSRGDFEKAFETTLNTFAGFQYGT